MLFVKNFQIDLTLKLESILPVRFIRRFSRCWIILETNKTGKSWIKRLYTENSNSLIADIVQTKRVRPIT